MTSMPRFSISPPPQFRDELVGMPYGGSMDRPIVLGVDEIIEPSERDAAAVLPEDFLEFPYLKNLVRKDIQSMLFALQYLGPDPDRYPPPNYKVPPLDRIVGVAHALVDPKIGGVGACQSTVFRG